MTALFEHLAFTAQVALALVTMAVACAFAGIVAGWVNRCVPRGPVSRWASDDDGWDQASLDELAAQKRIHDRRQGGAA